VGTASLDGDAHAASVVRARAERHEDDGEEKC